MHRALTDFGAADEDTEFPRLQPQSENALAVVALASFAVGSASMVTSRSVEAGAQAEVVVAAVRSESSTVN